MRKAKRIAKNADIFDWEEEQEEIGLGVSKSEIKRDAQALKKLAKKISKS